VRIDPDIVRGEKIARGTWIGAAAPAGQQLALGREDAHPPAGRRGRRREIAHKHAGVIAKLGDKDPAAAVDEDFAGAGHVGPLVDELALEREPLQAAVFAIGDIDNTLAIDGDAMRDVKFAVAGAGLTQE